MIGLEYAVVIEKASDNYCAYVPDLPGCVATGKTREETWKLISEAIVFHLEGLKEDGLPIPATGVFCGYGEGVRVRL